MTPDPAQVSPRLHASEVGHVYLAVHFAPKARHADDYDVIAVCDDIESAKVRCESRWNYGQEEQGLVWTDSDRRNWVFPLCSARTYSEDVYAVIWKPVEHYERRQ